MAFLKFNKAELVNLSYSLKREIICTNKTGAFCNTSIVCSNTRRYHGLLAVPIDDFDSRKHILLSSLDESIIVGRNQFNLGIHKYGEIYEPKGHKYIVDFNLDPIPEIVYKIGQILIVKSIVLAPDTDQLMLRYEVRKAPNPIELQLKPFLAYRDSHSLTHQNDQVNTEVNEISNGVSYCLYPGFPHIYMQLSSSKAIYKHDPHWYNGITYIDEARRGFECTEDLLVPGYFSVKLKEGDSIVFSASVEEVKTNTLLRKFNEIVKKTKDINNYRDQLLKCADSLITERKSKKMIVSGFSWLYTGQFRETLYALPGLTLYATGNSADFEEILDNLIKDNEERFFRRTTQVEAPLRLADVLQRYIEFGADPKKVWKKYGDIVKRIIESYAPGVRKEVSLQPNGLLWAELHGVALSWMNAYIDGRPVTERAGFQVETNAYWYNSLCFAIDMEAKYGSKKSVFVKEWTSIRELALANFQPLFWNEQRACLADYVDNQGQHADVRPNQLAAAWVPYSPIDADCLNSIMYVLSTSLETRRGIRTLSPRNPMYKGVYEGSQEERDLAYHQGSTRPFLLYQYVDVFFKMRGNAFYKKAEWLIEAFFEDLNKHGVGAFAELYDGDPPHEPHGAISYALSTASLLGVIYLMSKYREV